MIYTHTKFHVCNRNGSLVIAVKLKAEDNFRTTAMLLLSIVKLELPVCSSLQWHNIDIT
jgi:hypothetical protein